MKLDWKGIVGTVAPTIATALGGPLAGVAIKTLSSQLLGKPDATEQDVETAIAGADPQTMLKLKEIEVEFKKFITDSGIKLAQIDADDRANARAREIAVRDATPSRLAWLIVGGFMFLSAGVVVAMFAYPDNVSKVLKGEAGLFFGTLFGYLASEAKQCAAYYFGSSVGSKDKDETLATIAKMP